VGVSSPLTFITVAVVVGPTQIHAKIIF